MGKRTVENGLPGGFGNGHRIESIIWRFDVMHPTGHPL